MGVRLRAKVKVGVKVRNIISVNGQKRKAGPIAMQGRHVK